MLRIDTYANLTSVINVQHFYVYCQKFNEPHSLKPENNRTITGIGGISKAVEVAIIQVTFANLSVIFDANNLVLDQNIPILL